MQWLSKQLQTLESGKELSNHTYHACQTLYTKMGVLLNYADTDPQIFNQMVRCPKLLHPQWYAFLKDYQYLETVCDALDRLKDENKVLYNNIKKQETTHKQVSNVYVRKYGFLVPKTETTTTMSYHDLSKNSFYKAKLDSAQNMGFIFKHAEHAHIITDVLIRLHEGMIGKSYQEQAEIYMAMMMDKNPEMFLEFSAIFLSNSKIVLDQLKRTLTEAQFYTIIQQAIPMADPSSACISGCKP